MKKIPIILGMYALLANLASASGLSVSPARLELNASGANQTSASLIIANPTANVLVFEVYPDEFSEIISVNPESFTLEAGGRKEVSVMIDVANINESQKISTNISVIGKALAESKINIASGAKIPLTITASPSVAAQPFFSKYSLIILTALMIGLLLANKKFAR